MAMDDGAVIGGDKQQWKRYNLKKREVVLEHDLNTSSVLSLFHLSFSGHVTRSPLPGPEHQGAADAGGKAEGGGPGCHHPGERSGRLAEVQPQVLTRSRS